MIDGVDRLIAYRRLSGVPALLTIGIGRNAAFADWETLRTIVIGARLGATALILLTGFFWYTRRRRARISADALAAVLAGTEQAIRVENPIGAVVEANAGGALLTLPDGVTERTETRPADGAIIRTVRTTLPDGGAVLIGTDLTARHAAEARIAFLTNHDRLTGLPNRWRAASRIQELIGGRPVRRGWPR